MSNQSTEVVDIEGSGPVPASPDMCLLHLNFQPCPWCEPDSEFKEPVDATPQKRRGRPPGSRNRPK